MTTPDELRRLAESLIKREGPVDGFAEGRDLVHELRVYQAELEIQNDELRRSLLAVEQHRDDYRRLYDTVPVGLLIVDDHGLIQVANQMLASLVGREVVVGKPLYSFIHADDRHAFLARWRSFCKPGAIDQAIEVRIDAAEERWIRITRGNLNLNGDITGFSLAATDITAIRRSEAARLEAEQQLFQKHKMEAVGQLAGGMAHDFNNQLQVMMGYCELAGLTSDSAKRHRFLTSIEQAIEHSQHLIDQLLTFSRGGQIEKEVVNVGELLTELQRMVARTFDPRVRCSVDVNSTSVLVLSNRNVLHNALLNLCVNARDALVGGGRLMISCERVEVDAPWTSSFASERPAGSYVRIIVADNGQGMSPEVIKRATEPFFTTKPKGAGTGLGLAAVYGMVDGLAGDLVIASEVGRGTVITMLLPASQTVERETRTYRSRKRSSTAVLARRPKNPVLVVDDEENLRLLAMETLRDLGVEVATAKDGREAVEAVIQADGAFSLIIMDLLMPNMDGAEAISLIKGEFPAIPIILATGYGSDDHIEEARRAGVDAIIHKPYAIGDLSDLVSRKLAEARR